VLREVIYRLTAHDVLEREMVSLEPGALLTACSIRRHSPAEIEGGAEPYAVEFLLGGRRLSCALAVFQPRTRAVVSLTPDPNCP